MMLSQSSLYLSIDWQGLTGRHIIHLKATLESSHEGDRADSITHAVEMFRNMVGLEVIDDAVNAGEWPASDIHLQQAAADSTDPWSRTKES